MKIHKQKQEHACKWSMQTQYGTPAERHKQTRNDTEEVSYVRHKQIPLHLVCRNNAPKTTMANTRGEKKESQINPPI